MMSESHTRSFKYIQGHNKVLINISQIKTTRGNCDDERNDLDQMVNVPCDWLVVLYIGEIKVVWVGL